MQTLQPNPYNPEQPIRAPARFFGRADSLNWLTQRLLPHALIVVHGPPRIGISSLLLQLAQHVSDTYQSTYVLLAGQTLAAAMSQIVRLLATATGLPTIDSPQALHQAFSDSIHDTQRQPVLLALDGIATWQSHEKLELLNTLSLLASVNHTLRFVIGWGILADDTITRDMPLRLAGLHEGIPVAQLKLGTLSPLQSSELLTQTAGALLKYDYNALERINLVANGHPHALQLLGYALYERRALQGRVYARDLQQAIDDVIERTAPDLAALWNGLSRAEQLVLAAAATMRGEHGLLSISNLLLELSTNRIDLSAQEAREALTQLVRLDVCESVGAQSFRFSTGILRDWAVQYASLPIVTGKQPKPRTYGKARYEFVSSSIPWLRVLAWLALLLFVAVVLMNVIPATPLAALLGEPSPTPTPQPTVTPSAQNLATRVAIVVPPPAPKIVVAYMFRKSTNEKWRVYVAGDNGENAKPLTTGLADDMWPVWSPDGSKLAFSSNRDGNWEIYVMNADGSEQTRLTRHLAHDWTPTWSPDSSKIIFSSFRDRNWEIYMMNKDGSNLTRLTDDPAEDWSPVWSPDGRVIAFNSKRSGNHEIYLMYPDGSNITRLTNTTANNYSPTWSPDGHWLAFESFRDGNWEIYVMDGEGNNVKNLTNNLARDQSAAWYSDGRWLAFESNRQSASDIWVMRADGSDLRNWTNGRGIAQAPAWRPESKTQGR